MSAVESDQWWDSLFDVFLQYEVGACEERCSTTYQHGRQHDESVTRWPLSHRIHPRPCRSPAGRVLI